MGLDDLKFSRPTAATADQGLKRTPLFAVHQSAGARLIPFGGWEMPVQYSGIIDEHLAVRRAAGLFDISHMGEIRISGVRAEEFLNHLLTNDIRKLAAGTGQYTLMCNQDGGVIDDLYIYRLDALEYLLVVNASRIDDDFAWIQTQLGGFTRAKEVSLKNVSDEFGALALQGPRAHEFINACFPGPALNGTSVTHPSELKKNQVSGFEFGGSTVHVARTGYTGEDGFEIIAPARLMESLWTQTMAAGHAYCLHPAGLGARDTLRTEACYPLYGQELNEETTPMEAGLGYFVSLDKGEFVGRAILVEQKANGTARRCVAFKMTDKSAPPRPHYPIWVAGERVGEVSSGTQSPSLDTGIGLGYVPTVHASPGTKIEIEIRGKHAPAEIVPKPIYRSPNKPL
jgi:aminomethyltransferase